MAEYIIIGSLIAGGYLLLKKNKPTSASVTPIKGGGTNPYVPASASSGPVPPHLIAGANLLTDSQITEMEINIIGNHFTYKNDVPDFRSHSLLVLSKERLLVTDISPGTHCQSGGTYAGQPLALQVGKDGQLGLNTTLQISGALGQSLPSAIPIAGAVIGLGLSIFSAISAHHQAAVGNEQRLECQLVPPADYSLTVIEQAVINGTITIQQGQTALNTLYSDFVNSAKNGQAGQLEDRPGRLNAMGWYAHFLHAIIVKKQNRYASYAI